MKIFAGLAMVFVGVGVWAQETNATRVAALCRQADHVALPKLPLLSAAEEARLAKCDPVDLYYGLVKSAGYASARRCALYQISLPQAGGFSESSNYANTMAMGTLAMIYGNGDGVPRNVAAAIKFVCTNESEPWKESRRGKIIEALAKLKDDPAKRYDFCATVGGDFWKIVEMDCGAIEVDLKDKQRETRIVELTASWTEEQKTAFAALKRIHAAFVTKSVEGEPAACITGTAGEELEIRDELSQQFVDDLEVFERGKLPHFSHENAENADRLLNVSFRKVVDPLTERAKRGDNFCLKPTEPIRATERAWIAYRDAWLRFAQVRWPEISPDSWLTFLTKERAERVARMEF